MAVVILRGVAFAADSVSVSGVVSDRSGMPMAGARVNIFDNAGYRVVQVTGNDGRYRAIGLSFGGVVIEIEKTGLEPATTVCHIPSGGAARYDVQMNGPFGSTNHNEQPCTLEPDTSGRYIIR